MPTFRINTPGPNFIKDFDTADDALDWCDRYLPCGARSHRERGAVIADRAHVVWWTRVVTPSGKVKTGAAVYEIPARSREARSRRR